MKNIWFLSDHHLSHKNILNFKKEDGSLLRPFSSVDEMDEYIIEKHNTNVKPGDKVYFLGDVTFDKKKFPSIITRLNGAKRLILGNHDDVRFLTSGGWFQKVDVFRRFDDFGFVLTHVPVRLDQAFNHRKDKQMGIVHGHTHQHVINDPYYMNVCVEQLDYTPIHIDEIIAWLP